MENLFIFLITNAFIIVLGLILIVVMEENKTLVAIVGSTMIICLSAIGAYPIDPERHAHTGETHRSFTLRSFRKNLSRFYRSNKRDFSNMEMFYGCTTEPCVHEITAKWNSHLKRR